MAHLYKEMEKPVTRYRDRRFAGTSDDREKKLSQSTTLYVGNLAFYTSEEQLWAAFSRCGEVKRIIMGLDRNSKTPCGFCFIEYFRREEAQDAVFILNGLKVDERFIRVDWDTGFEQGRQYGRGKSGGQVRDEVRTTYDAGRGGYGKAIQADFEGQSGMDLWGNSSMGGGTYDDEGGRPQNSRKRAYDGNGQEYRDYGGRDQGRRDYGGRDYGGRDYGGRDYGGGGYGGHQRRRYYRRNDY